MNAFEYQRDRDAVEMVCQQDEKADWNRHNLLRADFSNSEQNPEDSETAKNVTQGTTNTKRKHAEEKHPKSCCFTLNCCGKNIHSSIAVSERTGTGKKPACAGLGLFYAAVTSLFLSLVALLAKKIEGINAVEISAIRCFFQSIFLLPVLIYNEIELTGPQGKRLYLYLRGILGAMAMISLFYAIQQMPLADATVIMFSNPVFTALFAWLFLKERCTIWDFIFMVFTLTGVVLIARPPFLFGSHISGVEGDYTNHLKGTFAAIFSAVSAALAMIIIRKLGKSIHYYLSVWYYAIIGLLESILVLVIINDWQLPSCGTDRLLLMSMSLLGIGGQCFLTKALQLEKAGPVSLMRTLDVVFAFVFQFIFLNRSPSWWSIGGALCVTASTTGVVIQKWYTTSTKAKQNEL
ncbi:solute carrier family 35 member G1 [Protopterus annectens]|uniref:solute carrier family 35 member G1 n=1 Tax=Protopterus annectens TaxID=7888 RepID=UPI001CFB2FF2|nr:solute carrier family 35 member G1 [Protopterus annectens]